MGDVWTVPATVLRAVDGDTLELKLSLGWHIYLNSRVRLVGVNAPEMDTDEGKAAKAWVVGLLRTMQDPALLTECTFVSHQLDKYGRPLGQVLLTSQQGEMTDLGAALVAAGHALPMVY